MCVARAVELRMKKSEDVKCVVVFFLEEPNNFLQTVYMYTFICHYVSSFSVPDCVGMGNCLPFYVSFDAVQILFVRTGCFLALHARFIFNLVCQSRWKKA